MKRCLQILAVACVGVIVIAAILLTPRFRNMQSEYATAQAIGDLKQYLRSHDGKWPESPGDLDGKYPLNGSVHVDYSMTSARLIENPSLLRDAVRPRSGRFHTFPHYDELICGLHEVLRESNPLEVQRVTRKR